MRCGMMPRESGREVAHVGGTTWRGTIKASMTHALHVGEEAELALTKEYSPGE